MAACNDRGRAGDRVCRRCGRLCRISLAIAGGRGEARPHGRRHRGADRRFIAGLRCDGIAGGRLWQAAIDLGSASDQCRKRHFPVAARQPVAPELLRRSRPFRRQHPQQRGGDAALGARTRLQIADRGDVELSHAAPDIELIPFAVVGDKWRDEPWWTSGATLRLLLSEYVKYVAAEMRVRLADAGLELTPELADQPAGLLPRRPATAQAN